MKIEVETHTTYTLKASEGELKVLHHAIEFYLNSRDTGTRNPEYIADSSNLRSCLYEVRRAEIERRNYTAPFNEIPF